MVFKKGHIPWNKGLKGFGDGWRHKTPWRKGNPWRKGYKVPEEQKEKISRSIRRTLEKKCSEDPEFYKKLVEHCRAIAKLGGQKVREQRKNNPEWKIFLKQIAPLGGKSVDIRKYHWKNKYKSFYEVLKIPVDEWARRVAKGCSNRPTQPELRLQRILDEYLPNEFIYTGDGKTGIVVGNMIPDFFNVNGKKKVIEIFGDYWHKNENPVDRINAFKKYGYDCLVIWEHELKDEIKVIEEVRKFVGNINGCRNRVYSRIN